MMLFRAEIHIWAKQLIDTNVGFRSVFLLGCSRMNTALYRLKGKKDVLCVIIKFLSLDRQWIVNILQQTVVIIESIEWKNYDERGLPYQTYR